MQVRDVTMDFGYGHAFTEASPEAYERLILDVLLGDPPLFPRQEEVELSLEDPRPDRGVLGDAGPARAVPPRHLGAELRRRAPRPRRTNLETPMIVDLPDTTTSQVSKTLVKIREEGGVVALGRVLTLVIATAPGDEEEAIEAANDASREHPMRVIVVSTEPERAARRGGRASTRRSASAATPARARSSCSAPAATRRATRRASSWGCSCPTRPSSPGGRAPRPRCPARRRSAASRSAASRMPRRSPTRRRRSTRSRRATRPATPTSRGRGSPSGAPSSPRCSTSRRTSRSRRVQVTGAIDSPVDHAARGVAAAAARGADRRASSRRLEHGSHGIHGVRLERASGDDRARPRRARRRDAAPAGPAACTTSRSPAAASATASPTSCAGSTPMSCTVRSSRAVSRCSRERADDEGVTA